MAKDKISTKDVLRVVGITGFIVASLIVPSLPKSLMYIVKQWKNISSGDLGRIIKRLEKQRMVNIKEVNGQIQIEITEKGKHRLLEYDFENIKIKKRIRDGKWRLVIFDIPENKKNSRDVFRKKLLQLGFIRVQDSVWASAFPCKNEVDFLCNYLDISDFVTLASLNKIERGEQLIFKKYIEYN